MLCDDGPEIRRMRWTVASAWLERVAARLTPFAHWLCDDERAPRALDAANQPVDPGDSGALRWNVLGAIRRERAGCPPDWALDAQTALLATYLGARQDQDVADLADRAAHARVLALLRAAAQRCRAQADASAPPRAARRVQPGLQGGSDQIAAGREGYDHPDSS